MFRTLFKTEIRKFGMSFPFTVACAMGLFCIRAGVVAKIGIFKIRFLFFKSFFLEWWKWHHANDEKSKVPIALLCARFIKRSPLIRYSIGTVYVPDNGSPFFIVPPW